MSIKNIRLLKFDNENKEKLLSFLDENPILFRSLQACIVLRDEPFEYYDGLQSLSMYEIYSLIKLKIKAIFNRFLPMFEVSDEDDLLFEMLDENVGELTSDHPLVVNFLDTYDHFTLEKLINWINQHKRYPIVNMYFNIYSADEHDRSITSDLSQLTKEIISQVDKFLSNFKINYKFRYMDESSSLRFELICRRSELRINYSN